MKTYLSRSPIALILVAATTLAPLAGCASLSNKEKGAIIGAAAGGAAGAAVGRANGSTAKGAIAGAIIGGTAGAVIGHQMDQQAKELQQNIPGATVERVGEGIQVTFASGLLFGFDSTMIRPAAGTNLQNLAGSLDKYPDSELLIVGHTDSVGTDAYNMTLSQERAQATADYLAAHGVARARLHVAGRGELEPVASNSTAEGRQQNRRVEVAIYASQAYRDRLKSQYGTTSGR